MLNNYPTDTTLNISKKAKLLSFDILKLFAKTRVDYTWSFSDCTRKDTAYITHGYHRYPAKFIPQLARRLIEEYTNVGNIVVDPFMGSGTTVVEAIMSERIGIGVDINLVAWLISKAKTIPIKPDKVAVEFDSLLVNIEKTKNVKLPQNERIDYWFPKRTKEKLAVIFSNINKIKNCGIKMFFLCGFSNILKNCSIWLQKSNKPTRDFDKVPTEPIEVFKKQIRSMMKKNAEFYATIPNGCGAVVKCQDARKLPVEDEKASLVVTSPPYVTSYEYADLHQLTALWLEYTDSLTEFRKKFIGTAHHNKRNLEIDSEIGRTCIKKLKEKDSKKSEEVAMYFGEMRECFIEMYRVLRVGGKACIVIGDTSFCGVDVPNAEVFAEQMQNIGFEIHKIIKREIPSKNLPSTRDPKTGQFTSSSNHKKILAYPTEYIIIMEKV
ncbi:MAG: site-specific DNA-methyltransferase [Elusimicrobia bacterium]|nr:site-specific DNA-methyltransferase [Elusimicrobiota bacterium]